MHKASVIISLLLVSCCIQYAASQTCNAISSNANYATSLFFGIVPPSKTVLIATTPFDAIQTAASSGVQLLLSAISGDSCRNLVAQLVTTRLLPPCSSGVPQPICRSNCVSLYSSCSALDLERASKFAANAFGATHAVTNIFDCDNAVAGVVTPYSTANSCYDVATNYLASPFVPRCVTWSSLNVSTYTFNGIVPPSAKVYLPAAPSVELALKGLEAKASPLSLILGSIQDDSCRDAFSQLFASKIFMTCETSHVAVQSFGIVLPRFPCKSSCSAVFPAVLGGGGKCSVGDFKMIQTILTGSNAALNCTGIGGVSAGLPDYPDSTQTFTSTLSSQCNPVSNYPINRDVFSYPTCVPYTGTICRGVVSGPMYYPARSCQQSTEDLLIDLPSLVGAVSANCSKHAANMLCNTAYMPCYNFSLSSVAPGANPLLLPRFPQRQLCLDSLTACPGYGVLMGGSSTLLSQLPTVNGALDIANIDTPANPTTKKWGYWPDIRYDGNKVSMLLGDKDVRNCSQIKNNPVGDFDYPISSTVFSGFIASPANPGSVPLANVSPVKATCQPFDSNVIKQLAAAKLASDPVEQQIMDQFRARKVFPNIASEGENWRVKSYCQGIIPEGTSIFVPAGANMTYLNDRARQVHWLFALLPRKNGCNVAFARYACMQIFNKCNDNLGAVTFPTYFPGLVASPYPVPRFAPYTLGAITQMGFAAAFAAQGFDTTTAGNFNNAVQNYVVTVPSAFPSFPCQSVCLDYSTKCADFLSGQESNSSLIPDCYKRKLAPSGPTAAETKTSFCNGTIKTAGQVDFPLPLTSGNPVTANCPDGKCLGTWFKTLGIAAACKDGASCIIKILPLQLVLRSDCNAGTGAGWELTAEKLPYVCPYPLKDPQSVDKFGRAGDYWSYNTVSDSSCTVGCPSILYDADQYQMSRNMIHVTTYLSFPLLFYMMLTWIIFPEKRGQRFILFFNINTFFANFCIFIGLLMDFDKTICKNIAEPYNSVSSYCYWQGLILQFSSQSAVMWWLIQSFDLWCKVVLEWKPSKAAAETKDIVYHLICWGYPAINVIAIGAGDSWGNTISGLPWCFIANDTYMWATFYGPLVAITAIGCFFMSGIISSVCKSTAASQGSAFSKGAWKLHIRPLAFILCFCTVFIFIFAYRFYAYFKVTEFRQNVVDWVSCHYKDQPKRMYVPDDNGNVDIVSECPLRQKNPPSLGFFLLIQFAVGCQGVFVFALYGTMSDNLKLWAGLCGIRAKTGRSRYEGQSQAASGAGSVAGSVNSGSRLSGSNSGSRVDSGSRVESGSKVEIASK